MSKSSASRIYLCPPHMSGHEQKYVQEAFDSNWLAPIGPNVDAFEAEFCQITGAHHALAVNSGTAALHLALALVGVGVGDEVLVSTLTFCASVNPILYLGGYPTFIDSETTSWNMDPDLLETVLKVRAAQNRLPKAVIVVHLYGQSANLDPIVALCQRYNVPLIEDAAEALGATYKGKSPGTFGTIGVFSFNGNKIITTTGGGMLITSDASLRQRAYKLATQAREPMPYYQHTEVGYNYRLSNVLAGIGRGQLQVLLERIQAHRQNFNLYQRALGHLPGIAFMPEAPWGDHSRWLTTLTVDPAQANADRETIRLALEAANIECRPVWKPMHLQPLYSSFQAVGGTVAASIFANGLCLPSGSNLTISDLERIVGCIKQVVAA